MKVLAPHYPALLALALFLVVGLAILDDYGVSWDEPCDRMRATEAWDFLAGDEEGYSDELCSVRLYGPSFDWALLFAERALGIESGRGAYVSQHLLIHLTHLIGGLFLYMLARRLSGKSLVGLFALLIFLLHPRLYAHSFFNSKDIAFLAMFIVALFLAHRAFSRDRVGAFALLGVGVGILVNLRIMGVMLLAAVPALRALDFALAQDWPERKRVLLSTGAFALMAGLVFFALLPYLWADPVGRGGEWWSTLSAHPYKPEELFRGTLYRSDEHSAAYVPVWFSITSPPFALALGLIGATAVLARSAMAPHAAMRSGRLRFGLLLIGCVAAPVAAVILLDANIYHGWRHVYFLWAPFSLLGALGLVWLASTLRRARFRTAVYGAAGAGIAATLISMALIHPNQQISFNFLVDRVAPEYLRTQYVMDYWGHGIQQAFIWLASSGIVSSVGGNDSVDAELAATDILPAAHRVRLPRRSSPDAFVVGNFHEPLGPALHTVSVYANTLATVRRKSDLRAVYETVRRREPFIDAAFDLHRLGGDLALVKEPCAPSFVETRLALKITPLNVGDLAPEWQAKGFERQAWPLAVYGAMFDGKCVALVPYPEYPVAAIEVEWSPPLLNDNAAREAMRQAKADGRLLARSYYDVYLVDGEHVYVRENCDPLETEHTFLLDIYPKRASDLSEDRRERGFERIRFSFVRNSAFVGQACVALFPLPDYPIAGFRTGQRIDGGGNLWRASFSANPESYRAVHRAAASSEPATRGVFDVYLTDGALVYVKEPCDQADTEARFFLHVVPEREDDLPEDRREYGFNGLDFDFFLNGAWFDAQCVARVPLPDYPIASARTGQHISGVREIWSAELALGR